MPHFLIRPQSGDEIHADVNIGHRPYFSPSRAGQGLFPHPPGLLPEAVQGRHSLPAGVLRGRPCRARRGDTGRTGRRLQPDLPAADHCPFLAAPHDPPRAPHREQPLRHGAVRLLPGPPRPRRHCGEGINETADSYSLRGCGVSGTAIRYGAGNKQPCHSLFPASAPRAPRLPPKSIDRSGNQGHHRPLLLHVVLLKSCLAPLLKPSFHSRIISRWPAKIIVACLNCSPLPSAMRACIELAAPARNPLFRSLHDIRTKPMKPSQAVLAERTRFNRI